MSYYVSIEAFRIGHGSLISRFSVRFSKTFKICLVNTIRTDNNFVVAIYVKVIAAFLL